MEKSARILSYTMLYFISLQGDYGTRLLSSWALCLLESVPFRPQRRAAHSPRGTFCRGTQVVKYEVAPTNVLS